MTICDPKHCRRGMATAVSSLSIPLSTLTEIERRIVIASSRQEIFSTAGAIVVVVRGNRGSKIDCLGMFEDRMRRQRSKKTRNEVLYA